MKRDLVGTHEVLTAGVDWITCTSSGTSARKNLYAYGRELVREQERNGERLRPYAPQGYRGLGAGGAFVGERSDGVMLRLSGPVAMGAWMDGAVRSSNISRLDLQVTVQGPPGLIVVNRHESEALARRRGRGRPFDVNLRRKNGTGQTLEIGSRHSETFCRCYDKHAQKPDEYPPGSWRYEVEYKQDRAATVATRLLDTDVPTLRGMALVHREYFQRGMRPIFAPREAPVSAIYENPAPDRERTLRWLRNGVTPTLRRAQHQGWLYEAIETLTTGVVPMEEPILWPNERRLHVVRSRRRPASGPDLT